jgi:carbon-monoxide dehydrogenase large subunit
MNLRIDAAPLHSGRYGIGQPVPRHEDPVLVQGQGRYTDDINLPGQLYGAMVRSQHAHGVIRAIDAEAALAMPGVKAVITAADLAAYGTMACHTPYDTVDGSQNLAPPRPLMASEKVHFVGEIVACVVADSALHAQDAAEAVAVDVDILDPVTTAREALATGAPQVHPEVPGNTCGLHRLGDADKVAAAFAKAAHVTRLRLISNRLVVNAMEPRSAIGVYDRKGGRFTLHVGCQGVFGLRKGLATEILKVPVDKVRVLTGNVGGAFGMKASVFPEYGILLHAARTLGRPVKWTDRRSESFVSDLQGRDDDFDCELALDKRGRFLAVRLRGYSNRGAYLTHVGPNMPLVNIPRNMASLYLTPLMEAATDCVLTNTVPIGAYRGAGRPEGNYFMERLIDTAAAEMGIDRVTLRRRNMIPRDKLPYKAVSGQVYDSGDFEGVLDTALAAADWNGFKARKRASAKAGKLRGIGLGCFLEVTAAPPGEMGGIRFEEDGTVTMLTGTLDIGEGHWSAFAQVVHQVLGVPFDSIRLLQGDSDQLIAGGGTGGSKSLMASGTALAVASRKVIENGRAIAAHVLEAGIGDIAFADGRFTIAGTDRGIGLIELARRLRHGLSLPEGMPQTLDVSEVHEKLPSAYPNGCHVAEVEIDPETGVVEVVKYTAIGDFGTVVNPMLVAGQMHGGVTQGIGQALLERTVYDESGQLVTGSYMDYGLPRADNLPNFATGNHPSPATTNELGVKGCGEAGCAGSLPSVMNAVVDALSVYGIRHIDMPATPERIWQAIRDAKAAKAA